MWLYIGGEEDEGGAADGNQGGQGLRASLGWFGECNLQGEDQGSKLGSSRDLADKTALDLGGSALPSEMANDNTFFTGSLEDTEKVMGGQPYSCVCLYRSCTPQELGPCLLPCMSSSITELDRAGTPSMPLNNRDQSWHCLSIYWIHTGREGWKGGRRGLILSHRGWHISFGIAHLTQQMEVFLIL